MKIVRGALVLCSTILMLPAGSFTQESQSQESAAYAKLLELMNTEIVTASKLSQSLADTPATMFVLTEEDIRLLGATSVPDLLRSVPGLDVMSAWDAGIEVGSRGLDNLQNSKLLVLVDGHRANNDFSGSMRWKDFPIFLENVKRIEISLSPLSALYGANSFAGMINIITKPAEEMLGVRAAMQAGEKAYQEYQLRYGKSTGKLAFTATAGWGQTEGWGNRDASKVSEPVLPVSGMPPATTAKLKDWWQLSKADARMEYRISDVSRLGVWAGAAFGHEALPDLLTARRKTADTHLPTRNGYGHIQYRRKSRAEDELRVDLSFSSWRDAGGGMPFVTRRGTAEVQYTRRIGSMHRLVSGAFGEKLSCQSSYLGEENPEDDLYGFYIQSALTPNDKIAFTTGLRYDKHTDLEGVMSPRIAMVWSLSGSQRIRLGLGTAFRKPSFLETYAQQSDGPTPETSSVILGVLEIPGGRRKPERLTSFDADYQAALGGHLMTRLDLFYNSIKDTIILKKVEPFPPYKWAVVYDNLQSLNIKGLEVELRWLMGRNLQSFANYSYQDIDYTSPTTSEKLSVPKVKWNVGMLSTSDRGLSGSFVIHHVGAKEAQFGHPDPDLDYQFMRIPAYTTVDLSFTYRRSVAGGEVELGLTGLNVFDRSHMEFPIWDGNPAYFGFDPDPAKSLTDAQKRMYENRNALNDRRVLARLAYRF